MQKILGTLTACTFAIAALFSSNTSAVAASAVTSDQQAVLAANQQFCSALNAMFAGEFAPLAAIWSHRDDVTFMGPFGDRFVGWAAIGGDFKHTSTLKLGGKIECTEALVVASGDLGYVVYFEVGHNLGSDGKTVAVKHRVTNVFRREDGHFRLIHHHTDLAPQLIHAVPGAVKP